MGIIAFDLHGTIDTDPNTFKMSFQFLRESNKDKIAIISGPPKDQIEKELKALNLVIKEDYDYIFSVVDHLLEKGLKPIKVQDGNYWFDEEEWWKSKSEICKKIQVEVITDNDIRYAEYFVDQEHPKNFHLFSKTNDGSEIIILKLMKHFIA